MSEKLGVGGWESSEKAPDPAGVRWGRGKGSLGGDAGTWGQGKQGGIRKEPFGWGRSEAHRDVPCPMEVGGEQVPRGP